jgi:UDP-N-acetylglucosamine/UDP-N-acetylgalactosamine 4-epimerase
MILKYKKRWLITGVAGFIGSNLLETLLVHNQKVVGIDNFVTGSKKNLELIKKKIGPGKWNNFKFIRGNIENEEICKQGCKNINYVLHQAAIGSVPRSIKDPITTNKSNVTGFLNLINAAKNAKVEKFIYASSSSVYGDNLNLPKIEEKIGNALSPYAFTKQINETYARIFSKLYGLKCVGLRYFNVFGKNQNPNGTYAAVVPRWIISMINNKKVKIFGDGNTTRDFCFIENVVQANISAAIRCNSLNEVYNVANGNQISLNNLFYEIKKNLKRNGIIYDKLPEYLPFRNGDIRYSLANINKIKKNLKYKPLYNFKSGIKKLIPWYIERKNFYKINND